MRQIFWKSFWKISSSGPHRSSAYVMLGDLKYRKNSGLNNDLGRLRLILIYAAANPSSRYLKRTWSESNELRQINPLPSFLSFPFLLFLVLLFSSTLPLIWSHAVFKADVFLSSKDTRDSLFKEILEIKMYQPLL